MSAPSRAGIPSKNAANPAYYTVNQMAAHFNLHAKTIYQMIDRGDLPAIKINPTSKRPIVRVPAAAFEAWEAAQLEGTK
jgi:excisionase family DNA binding protein